MVLVPLEWCDDQRYWWSVCPLQELAMNFIFQAPHARLSRVRQFDLFLWKGKYTFWTCWTVKIEEQLELSNMVVGWLGRVSM